jgi:GrpB-like predicted nucleotidyltransferase (UPF0157 family)
MTTSNPGDIIMSITDARAEAVNIDVKVLDEPVEIQPYDSEWRVWYRAELLTLVHAFGGSAAAFEHVGSSAVEGLDSKPVVDVLVGLVSPVDDAVIARLEHAGYEYFGKLHPDQDRLFARKRGDRSYNLQMVPFGSTEWYEKLALRDFLRRYPEEKRRYAEVKREAVSAGKTSLLSYHEYKSRFLVPIVQEAMRWYTQYSDIAELEGTRTACEEKSAWR